MNGQLTQVSQPRFNIMESLAFDSVVSCLCDLGSSFEGGLSLQVGHFPNLYFHLSEELIPKLYIKKRTDKKIPVH